MNWFYKRLWTEINVIDLIHAHHVHELSAIELSQGESEAWNIGVKRETGYRVINRSRICQVKCSFKRVKQEAICHDMPVLEHFENRSVTLGLCPDIEKPVIREQRAYSKTLEHHFSDNWSLFKLEYMYIWNDASNLTHPVKILSLGAEHYGTTAPN